MSKNYLMCERLQDWTLTPELFPQYLPDNRTAPQLRVLQPL